MDLRFGVKLWCKTLVLRKDKVTQWHTITFGGSRGLGPAEAESIFDLGIGTSNGSGKFRALGGVAPLHSPPLDPPLAVRGGNKIQFSLKVFTE